MEEEHSFAFELLQKYSQQNERQQNTIVLLHRIIIILIFAIVIMIISFFVYESQFETITEDTSLEQTQENVNNSSMIGEIE